GLLGPDALEVRAAVVKAQRVARLKIGEPFFERIGVQKLADALRRAHWEIMAAFRAAQQALCDLFTNQCRLASIAGHPDASWDSLRLEVSVPGVRESSLPQPHGLIPRYLDPRFPRVGTGPDFPSIIRFGKMLMLRHPVLSTGKGGSGNPPILDRIGPWGVVRLSHF